VYSAIVYVCIVHVCTCHAVHPQGMLLPCTEHETHPSIEQCRACVDIHMYTSHPAATALTQQPGSKSRQASILATLTLPIDKCRSAQVQQRTQVSMLGDGLMMASGAPARNESTACHPPFGNGPLLVTHAHCKVPARNAAHAALVAARPVLTSYHSMPGTPLANPTHTRLGWTPQIIPTASLPTPKVTIIHAPTMSESS
jgi:hypothetical protein